MAEGGRVSNGRWGFAAVLLAMAVAGCVADPNGVGGTEGKVNGGRGKATLKPATGTGTTVASTKPGGLTGEKPGDDPRGSDDPSLAKPSPVPSASNAVKASADANASTTTTTNPTPTPSVDPNATPTAPPSTTATPEPEPTDGPIQRVARFWGARVLAGGTKGTPTDGTGTAAIFGLNQSQLVGMLALPVTNPTRLYVTDASANQLRSLNIPADANASATVRLELGDPARQPGDAAGGIQRLRKPTGVAADSQGRILLVEADGSRLFRYDPASYTGTTQTVTELAGMAVMRGTKPAAYADGAGNVATFLNLAALATDGDTAYLVESGYLTLRSAATATAGCPISFVAGPKAEIPSLFDPPILPPPASCTRAQAVFMGPRGTAVGIMPAGATGAAAALAGKKVLFVAESFRHCIRAVDLTEGSDQVVTLVGAAGTSGTQDGALSQAKLDQPGPLALDNKGILYVGENGNSSHRLRAVNFVTARLETVVGESGEGTNIRLPDTNIPRGQVELSHVAGIAVVNGPNLGDGATRIFVHDFGSFDENPTRPGGRILELKPLN